MSSDGVKFYDSLAVFRIVFDFQFAVIIFTCRTRLVILSIVIPVVIISYFHFRSVFFFLFFTLFSCILAFVLLSPLYIYFLKVICSVIKNSHRQEKQHFKSVQGSGKREGKKLKENLSIFNGKCNIFMAYF